MIVAGCLGACSGSGDQDKKEGAGSLDALKEEVIDIHDEVMPSMENIIKLRSTFEAKLTDSTAAVDSLEYFRTMVAELNAAEKGMMDWMRAYEPKFKGEDEVGTRAYFEEEKAKIVKVKQMMGSSIAKGNQALGR